MGNAHVQTVGTASTPSTSARLLQMGVGRILTSSITQRVRYAETDGMGVVYYANYLIWFEVGRNDLFRHIGLPYAEVESRGIYIPVSEVRCRILLPARYDDEITVHTSIREVRSRKMVLEYRIERDRLLLAEGETTHICLNAEQRVTTMPEWMNAKLRD